MLKTLRSRLLLSYAAVILVMILLVGFTLLLVLAVSQRDRIQPQLVALLQMSRATQGQLRLNSGGNGFQPETAAALLEAAAEESGSRILVIDDDRQVVFDSEGRIGDRQINFRELRVEQIPIFEQVTRNARFGRIGVNGTTYLAHAQPLPRGAGALTIVHAVPESTPLTAFRDTFLRPLALSSFVAFLVAIVLAWLISRSVSLPLQKMAQAAEAIADGDYNQQLAVRGPTEVATVANSFNRMAGQVKATNQAQRDFVANVSHDLKTPLTSIQGWSQALVDGATETGESRRHAAGVIHDEADRMTRMVNQLLLLAKLESGRLELRRQAIDLAELAYEVRRSLLFQAQEKGITLEVVVANESAALIGDRDQLIQLFTNLVQNALNHTPRGGIVSLLVESRVDERFALIVQDTGQGIVPEDLERIFERFYQVDRARSGRERGTGLGLAIAQQIVHAHGGTIRAESEVGVGSRFIVELPLVNGGRSPEG